MFELVTVVVAAGCLKVSLVLGTCVKQKEDNFICQSSENTRVD